MINIIKRDWFKIFAIVILFGALWNHPYSYYQLLRWVVSITGAISAYKFFEAKNEFWGWVFVFITILFNPIAPIYLSKDTWQILDVLGAVIFTISLFRQNIDVTKSENNNE